MNIKLEFSDSYKKSRYRNALITEETIKNFERDTGLRLPQDYINFLLEQKWGIVKNEYEIDNKTFYLGNKISFYDGEIGYFTIEEFNYFKPDEEKKGRKKYFIIDEENEKFPYTMENYGHFGIQLFILHGYADQYSIFMCLNPEENFGQIYLFNEECLYSDIKKDCIKIANSFTEFINNLSLIEI